MILSPQVKVLTFFRQRFNTTNRSKSGHISKEANNEDMASNTLQRLRDHLTALEAQPSTTVVDGRLIDEAELVLPNHLSKPDLQLVVGQISKTLLTIQQDPSPLTELLQKLLQPFTFEDVLAFQPPVDFTAGLTLADHMVSINKLMIYLLSKASRPSDAATVANSPDIVKALVDLWLRTPDTGIAAQAGSTITDLLKIDLPVMTHPAQVIPERGTGQGLFWKRMFTDKDVYGTIFTNCDLKSANSTLSKQQISLAQARLLEVLPRIAAMDWTAVSTSHNEEVETSHAGHKSSLLALAAVDMVDYANDILAYSVLLHFYTELISIVRDKDTPASAVEHSEALEFLIQSGIHDRMFRIYLQQGEDADPLSAMILLGPAASYIATYASLYQNHYVMSEQRHQIHNKLMSAFGTTSVRWTQLDSTKHDLFVLASIPRSTLIPSTTDNLGWSRSPISFMPSTATTVDVLNALAAIFHGPDEEIITFPPPAQTVDGTQEKNLKEAAAARAVYLNYVANNKTFWKDIARHADTVALEELALAAIRLLYAVITANWSTDAKYPLPSATIATPESGYIAILSPPALEYALPYLMKPPQTFSNLVGGRGDAESAAYKVAVAKYDCLKAFHSRLAAHVQRHTDSGFEDVVATLAKQLAEGPMSRGEEVGGRIATLDL